MAQQNIYDNEIFFEGYRKIRKKEGNANDLFEIPALLSMMPDLKGKRVLDPGCGYGDHCKLFVDRGAINAKIPTDFKTVGIFLLFVCFIPSRYALTVS